MSKTATLRAMDLYLSELRNITPSKLQSREKVPLGRSSQVVKLPMTTRSERVEDALQAAVLFSFSSYMTIVAKFLTQQISGQVSSVLPKFDDRWTSPSSANYLAAVTQHTRAIDLSLLRDDVRPSNVLQFSLQPLPESKRSGEEDRYKRLNQKHYDGTITEEEQRELVKIGEALDEADTKDPYLMKVKKTVEEGYDKLHTGLYRINKILDDLLPPKE